MFANLTAVMPMVAMNEPTEMSIDAIRVVSNVREEIGDVADLVASIRQHGVIGPLIVKPDGELIAGQRRLAAAKAAGLTHVPVRVLDVCDPRTVLEIGLLENVQRRDLDPLSRAHAYHALLYEHGASIEEVAALVGQGRAHVYQYVQLLELHSAVQRALREEKISFADARELAPLALADQVAVLDEILALSKRPTSRQVKQRVQAQRALAAARRHSAQVTAGDTDDTADAYGALFSFKNDARPPLTTEPSADALAELNVVIAEMIGAAQGEDQTRAWARRLSHVAAALARHS